MMMRWVITEVQELQAMQECIKSIQKLETKLSDLREKLQDDKDLLAAQQQNKTTLLGLWRKVTFKSQTEE